MTLDEVILFVSPLRRGRLGAAAFGLVDDRLGSRTAITIALIGSSPRLPGRHRADRMWLWVAGSASVVRRTVQASAGR
jgi:hypothetical protein